MKTTLSLLLTLVLSNSVLADVKMELVECSKLTEANERLNCYDRLSNSLRQQNQVKTPIIATSIAKSPDNTLLQQSFAADKVSAEPREKVIALSHQQTFGRSVDDIFQVDSLNSSIVGEFKGWKKGNILKLANGQSWKVTAKGNRWVGSVKLNNPEIKITRGALGSYNMKVEGLRTIAKVKRVD